MWSTYAFEAVGIVVFVLSSWRLIFKGSSSIVQEAPDPVPTHSTPASVTILIPARNESENLGELITSLLGEGTVVAGSIVVIDDDSDDNTARVGIDLGCRVLFADRPKEGVNGKSAALAGAMPLLEGGLGSDIVIFVDADVRFRPGSIVSLLVKLQSCGGLVSVQPFHQPGSLSESAALFFNLISLQATGAFTPWSDGRTEAVFGPVLASRIGDYLRVGGHAAVVNDVLDDVGLAGRYRSTGLPTTLFVGAEAINFRMYPGGFGQLVAGFRKNIALGASRTAISGVIMGFLVVSGALSAGVVAPIDALVHPGVGDDVLAVCGFFVWALALWIVARRIGRFSLLAYLLFPLPLVVFLGVLALSALDVVRGRVNWRGRSIRVGRGRR